MAVLEPLFSGFPAYLWLLARGLPPTDFPLLFNALSGVFTMSKKPVRVAVTGAAGQIGYALLFRIASGEMLGKDCLLYTSPSPRD